MKKRNILLTSIAIGSAVTAVVVKKGLHKDVAKYVSENKDKVLEKTDNLKPKFQSFVNQFTKKQKNNEVIISSKEETELNINEQETVVNEQETVVNEQETAVNEQESIKVIPSLGQAISSENEEEKEIN